MQIALYCIIKLKGEHTLTFLGDFYMNMKAKSSIVLAMLTMLSLTACNSSDKNAAQSGTAQEEVSTQTVEQPAIDESQQPEVTVVDGMGVLPQSTYSGMLPCADCPGIQTNLTLNADGTFVMEQEYLDKPDGQVTTKGTYDINGLDNRYVLLHPEGQSDMSPYLIYMDKDTIEFRDIENGEEPAPTHTLNLVS